MERVLAARSVSVNKGSVSLIASIPTAPGYTEHTGDLCKSSGGLLTTTDMKICSAV